MFDSMDMKNEKHIYALGFFDGVHLGHQALLNACRDLAQRLDCGTAAITFDAHPRSLFSESTPALISTVEDRTFLLKFYGIASVHVFPVSSKVMSTSWKDFLELLLQQGAAGFVCGDDFHFGSRGEGNAEKLQSFCASRGLPCIIIPEQTLKGNRVSSSLIRRLVQSGEMESATRYLGHPHVLTGQVLHGKKLGRTLGVPTANLQIPAGIAVPKFGVYACRAIVDGASFPAVANVGTRPTVSGNGITVEPWILDFEGDLYGKEIRLEFYRFLRSEMKFSDLAKLKEQIHNDAEETRRYFENL